MKVIVLGSGPTEPIIGKNRKGRLQSSILIDNCILFDATPSIDLQLKNLNPKIKQIFITHAHMDCIAGLKLIDKYVDGFVNVYAMEHTLKWINKRLGKLKNVVMYKITDDSPIKVQNHIVTPILVEHSVLQPKFDPTLAYMIDGRLIYAEDVDYEFFYSEKANKLKKLMKSANLTILDGAMCVGKIRGHLNIFEAANYLKENRINNVCFTQIGKSCDKYSFEDLKRKIKEIDPSFDICYDGQTLELTDENYLQQEMPGMYLIEPHARMIWQGSKTLIIKGKNFRNSAGKLYYLIGGNNVYGIIKINLISPIGLKQFKELEPKHKITNEERSEWWNGKQELYAYNFTFTKRFDEPKTTAIPQGVQTFIRNVKFLNDRVLELIKDVPNYDPSKIDTDVLKDDFRIALAWYSSKKQGKDIRYSLEEIENLLQLIVSELIKRGIKFHPDKMTPNAREAFIKVSKRIETGKLSEFNPPFMNEFTEAVLIKDFISLIGSSVETNKYHDIDVLVRMSKPPEYLKRAIETRIYKMLPEDYGEKLHFVYGDAEGPHDVYIPLYDLKLSLLKPFKTVKMSKNRIEPLKPFIPMKPRKRFYQIDDIIKYMFGG
jgi:phosphoribosyl 1,2-cyclic phosphodiesterase